MYVYSNMRKPVGYQAARQKPERRPARPGRRVVAETPAPAELLERIEQRARADRRTTVAMSGDVHIALRQASVATGISAKQLVETAVMEYLKKFG